MKREKASKPLDRFRRRAAEDPFFLGHALNRFAAERRFGDAELAEFLGCAVERLPKLLACRSPDPAGARFGSDVGKIAEFARCREERLLAALREVSVLGVLRALPGADEDAPEQKGLLAARQRRNKTPRKAERGHDDDRPRGT